MMRAVLDSHVLLAVLISPHGAADALYRAWRAGHFEIVTSVAQLDEVRRASRHPKFQAVLQMHKVNVMLDNFQRATVLECLPAASGSGETYLLEMARAGDAEYLVAGTRQAVSLQLASAGKCRIVTPEMFCRDEIGQQVQ